MILQEGGGGARSAGRPEQLASAKQVKVQVEDGLSSLLANVGHDAVPVLRQTELACNLSGCEQQVSEQSRIFSARVIDGNQRLPRDDQQD